VQACWSLGATGDRLPAKDCQLGRFPFLCSKRTLKKQPFQVVAIDGGQAQEGK